MRAEEVIATHGNTDFDAFASMLAARRLYPDAVVCVSGSLSRNVREFDVGHRTRQIQRRRHRHPHPGRVRRDLVQPRPLRAVPK